MTNNTTKGSEPVSLEWVQKSNFMKGLLQSVEMIAIEIEGDYGGNHGLWKFIVPAITCRWEIGGGGYT